MIWVGFYLMVIALSFILYAVYKIGYQLGYSAARRDYRQGLRLVEGHNARKKR